MTYQLNTLRMWVDNNAHALRYICDMQDKILFFGYNASRDALSRVVQTRGHDITSCTRYDVTF